MMRCSLRLLGPLGVLALAGCPGPDATVLWLSPVGSDETRVQLVETEPPPF